MPRMPKKRKLELSFFLNERGRVTYNDLCRKCQRTCKQSFRAVIVDCPYYLSKRSKRKVLMLSLAVMISLCHADMRLPGYLSWNVSCDGAAIRTYHGRA